jgi:phosphatase NudJ
MIAASRVPVVDRSCAGSIASGRAATAQERRRATANSSRSPIIGGGSLARAPIPTWYFALVVVQHQDKFLLVHERKHEQRWYLPAGRAEMGETLQAAAYRETLEETGVPVRLTGVLRVEHSPLPGAARLRAIFLAEPIDDTPPKAIADKESLGAAWVSLDELHDYPLRGPEVEELLRFVANRGPLYPLSLLQLEGMPFRI